MTQTLIMKFGGASLAEPAQFDAIAELILARAAHFPKIVAVVSAMGKTTDELIRLAREVHPEPPQREYDMLISVGERISMSLLAMAIAKRGGSAVSFTGSQSGIITSTTHSEAKIIDVRPRRLVEALQKNQIAIVAGFQGVSREGEITTLGRGGSDTTAVALGVALQAEKVEFYKDVPGIFSDDPKKNPHASLFQTMSYDEAIHLTGSGAKILHQRSLILAKQNEMSLHVLSFKKELQQFGGTVIEKAGKKETPQPLYEVHSCT